MVYKCVILKTALRLLSLLLSTTVLIRKHSKIQCMNIILDSPVLHDVFVNWIDLVYSWALRLLGICCLLWHPTHALIHTHTQTHTHTHTYTHIDTHSHTHRCRRTHAHTHTRTHTRAHTRVHTHVHSRIRATLHTHT